LGAGEGRQRAKTALGAAKTTVLKKVQEEKRPKGGGITAIYYFIGEHQGEIRWKKREWRGKLQIGRH